MVLFSQAGATHSAAQPWRRGAGRLSLFMLLTLLTVTTRACILCRRRKSLVDMSSLFPP